METKKETKQCPACKELMNADASTCPHCGNTQLNKWMWGMVLFFMTPVFCCLFLLIIGILSPAK